MRQEPLKDMEGQRYNCLELPAYPGFFIIKDEFGKCVGIYGNTNRAAAKVRAIDCNPSEAGHRWKWSYPYSQNQYVKNRNFHTNSRNIIEHDYEKIFTLLTLIKEYTDSFITLNWKICSKYLVYILENMQIET